MSSPDSSLPPPAPGRFRSALKTALKAAGWLVLVGAIAVGASWAVFEWRMAQVMDRIQQEQQDAAAQVQALRTELERQQAGLQEKVAQVEEQLALVKQAAEEARAIFEQDGEAVSLDARLREIETLKLELQQVQQAFDEKLQALEQSVVEEVARQGEETAQALSVELRWKSLLIKAQGEVLLAQFYYAEGNRGLAKDELAVASRTLVQAMEQAPGEVQEAIRPVADLAEEAKAALILEQPSARDQLNLLWHRISDLLAE